MRCSFALAALLTGCLQVGAFAREEVIVDARELAAAAEPAWQLETDVEGARNGTILSAPAELEPTEFLFDSGLNGWYDIRVGLHRRERALGPYPDGMNYPAAINLRLDSDAYRLIAEPRQTGFQEVPFRQVDLTGRQRRAARGRR